MKILLDIADALEANEENIKIENDADVSAAIQAGTEKPLVSRLTLKPGKVRHHESSKVCFCGGYQLVSSFSFVFESHVFSICRYQA